MQHRLAWAEAQEPIESVELVSSTEVNLQPAALRQNSAASFPNSTYHVLSLEDVRFPALRD